MHFVCGIRTFMANTSAEHAEDGNKYFQALLDVTSTGAIVTAQAGDALACSPMVTECASSEDLYGKKEKTGVSSGKMQHYE